MTRFQAKPNLYSRLDSVESGLRWKGTVAGVPVSCIYLDTGCSQMFVRRELIPKGDILAESVELKCVHGDVARYSLVFVEVVVEGRRLKLKLRWSGWEVTSGCVVENRCDRTDEACECSRGELSVMTRAQTQRQHAKEEREKKLNETAGVTLNTVELDDEVESIFPFDDESFQEVKVRVKKTKSEKRVHNRQRLEDEQ